MIVRPGEFSFKLYHTVKREYNFLNIIKTVQSEKVEPPYMESSTDNMKFQYSGKEWALIKHGDVVCQGIVVQQVGYESLMYNNAEIGKLNPFGGITFANDDVMVLSVIETSNASAGFSPNVFNQ